MDTTIFLILLLLVAFLATTCVRMNIVNSRLRATNEYMKALVAKKEQGLTKANDEYYQLFRINQQLFTDNTSLSAQVKSIELLYQNMNEDNLKTIKDLSARLAKYDRTKGADGKFVKKPIIAP
jgi:hypothetical protein